MVLFFLVFFDGFVNVKFILFVECLDWWFGVVGLVCLWLIYRFVWK